MNLQSHLVIAALKQLHDEHEEKRVAAERAFIECPTWRVRRRERLRDERTAWRMLSSDSARMYLEALIGVVPIEEAFAELDKLYRSIDDEPAA